MYDTSSIRKGLKVEIDGEPWIVVSFQFVKPGKGVAFTRTRIKNMISGAVNDVTYRTGEKLKPASMDDRKMQFLYRDGDDFHFMDTESYDQVPLPLESLGDVAAFIKENDEVDVLFFQERPVSVSVTNFVELEVVRTEPGVKGDTASGATKPAELETGHTVQVPLFIEEGEVLKIDTRTGAYVERVKR